MSQPTADTPQKTPLHNLHDSMGAKMVPFARYHMPVQFSTGILTEHLHTRSHAGLFDVSHMGQIRITGPRAAEDLETLVPGDLRALALGEMRYTLFTTDDGGILDDLMVTRVADGLFVVVNAACKDADFAHMKASLRAGSTVEMLEDRALLALQGPEAVTVLQRLSSGVGDLSFMTAAEIEIAGITCFVSRSGYTGEDGFEISVAADRVVDLATQLLDAPEVAPIGLGARDSLRLEAGLCLYGHDIGTWTTPIEAALTWTIGKRRRAEGGFPGAARILAEIKDGPIRKRVGILPEGRAPAREHTGIQAPGGDLIGEITSGGFGPTVGGPVAMGYVAQPFAKIGTQIELMVRGTARPARVVALPFAPHHYVKKT
jgi:aminomethyltransferase